MQFWQGRMCHLAGDWIKLHRKLLDHPTMQHDGLCRLWMYCLLRANWKPARWTIPGTTTVINLPRGSFVTGRARLHKKLYPDNHAADPSDRTLWRWLQSLKKMGCISVQTVSNRFSIVTICKYSTYQDVKDKECPAPVPPVSSTCPAGVPPVSTEEERKKDKKDKNFLSLTLADGVFEFPQRWQIPSLVRALGNWTAHIVAQGKPFQRMHLEALLLHHAQAGWSAEKLERGIRFSLSKSTQTTILDPEEHDRPANGTGGRRQKDYTP